MRAAVLDEKGNIVNVIVADAAKDVLKGFELKALPDDQPCDSSFKYDGAKYIAPPAQASGARPTDPAGNVSVGP